MRSALPKPSRSTSRTPSREIARALRERIVNRMFAPGQRLPTHADIERQFRSTTPTVSKALDLLRGEGFIHSERGRGIFVAERPPHLHHFALAIPFGADERLSRYYVALRREAMRYASSGRRQMSVFYDIGPHTDVPDHRRLLGLVREHRLAGLIFATPPYSVVGSPILEEPDVPRVIIGSTSDWAGVPAVSRADLPGFFDRALDALAARGRRRVAMLCTFANPDTSPLRYFGRAAQRRGMIWRPSWTHGIHPDHRPWAANFVQSMFAGARAGSASGTRQRPDALIIMDDNIVPDATAGLARCSGIRVPEDVEVIAHANFPHATPSAVPARRLGYDIRRLLALCMERLETIRRGQTPPPATWLPALFEDELNVPELAEKVIYPKVNIGWGSPSFPAKLHKRMRKRPLRANNAQHNKAPLFQESENHV